MYVWCTQRTSIKCCRSCTHSKGWTVILGRSGHIFYHSEIQIAIIAIFKLNGQILSLLFSKQSIFNILLNGLISFISPGHRAVCERQGSPAGFIKECVGDIAGQSTGRHSTSTVGCFVNFFYKWFLIQYIIYTETVQFSLYMFSTILSRDIQLILPQVSFTINCYSLSYQIWNRKNILNSDI